jgi:hypothetical protein
MLCAQERPVDWPLGGVGLGLGDFRLLHHWERACSSVALWRSTSPRPLGHLADLVRLSETATWPEDIWDVPTIDRRCVHGNAKIDTKMFGCDTDV